MSNTDRTDYFSPNENKISDKTFTTCRLPHEGVDLEYKREVPESSDKFLKTVIAFANGNGGRIVFGVDDKTREVIGFSDEIVAQESDRIANIIVDSCVPAIRPNIYIREIAGKQLIECEVSAGAQSPYYLKSKGFPNGIFIRVGATTRIATEYEIRELAARGLHQSPDQMEVHDINITQSDVDKLCADLMTYTGEIYVAYEMAPLTPNRLMSMHVVEMSGGRWIPTIAYAILAGAPTSEIFYNIQCVAFKGLDKGAPLLEQCECRGPIYRQIYDALGFLKKWLVCTPIFESIQRIDRYELPMNTLRELIVNAVCHRSYLIPAQIQVLVFSDRVEITSPGMLLPELTIDRIREGYSVVRNRSLVEAFRYLHLVERLGTGIPRAIASCREYGLREPGLDAIDSTFRVTIYRDTNILLQR